MPQSKRSKRASAREYTNLVADVRELKPRHEPLSLRRYWKLGGKVSQMGSQYGDGRVSQLAEDTGCSAGLLYVCQLFRKLWSKKSDLERVIKRGLLFGHIRALCHRKLTSQEREKLEQYVAKHRPTVTDFHQYVSKRVKGRK